jgi:hypothetical protein
MSHNPGKYLARIVDANLLKSAKNTPTVALMFEYYATEGGEIKKIAWFGSLNGGAREHTVNALVRCGFKGDSLIEVKKGPSMFEDVEYEIVIENQPNPNKNNKIEPRVKWINTKGGSGFQEKMEDHDAIELCKGFDIKADLMEARQRLGKSKPSPLPKTTGAAIPMPSEMTNLAGPAQEEMDVGF